MNYLLFRLYGAMASWGKIAVGETRHTETHPSKSALVGLLSAAVGITRDQENELMALAQGYQFAIWQPCTGDVLTDYHTTQVPDSVGKYTYRNRREEIVMGKDRLGTILSSREYMTDNVNIIAIKIREQGNKDKEPPYSLEQLQKCLQKPKFHLYLGRKSCPISVPLHAQLMTNLDSFMQAFEAYDQLGISVTDKNGYYLPMSGLQRYYWEGDIEALSSEIEERLVQTVSRYDDVRSRKRWQFKSRLEHYYQCDNEFAKED